MSSTPDHTRLYCPRCRRWQVYADSRRRVRSLANRYAWFCFGCQALVRLAPGGYHAGVLYLRGERRGHGN